MGACLCKSKRRSGATLDGPAPSRNHRFRLQPSEFGDDANSAYSHTSSSSSSSGSSSSGASTASSASIQQRLGQAHELFEAAALSGSCDVSQYMASVCGKTSPSVMLQNIQRQLGKRASARSAEPGGQQQVKQPGGQHHQHRQLGHAHGANERFWSLQSKLALHADRLVTETLESIRPTVLNEPSNTMQKLHLISETELGWLVVVSSLINKVDLEHPFGSALILLILEDAPLPTRKSIAQLDQILALEMLEHERSVVKQRNISIVLGCLAEKLAGALSTSLFSERVQDYLLSRIEPTYVGGVASQVCTSSSSSTTTSSSSSSSSTSSSSSLLNREPRANELASDANSNKSPGKARLVASKQIDNDANVILYSLIALEKFSQTIDNKLLIMKRLNQMGANNPLAKLEHFKSSENFVKQQVGFCATWDLDNYFLLDQRPYSYETIDRDNINCMLNAKDASENLKISADGLVARNDTSRFESVRCTWPVASGVYYYEVQLITPGVMQIGFATKQSKFLNHDGFGIGDDDQSFAYDGCRQLLWQNAKSTLTNLPRWKEGDIVGCLIDLERLEISFSLNGKMSAPSSDLFKNKPLSTQYYAAASFMPFQQCVFNFGRVPFAHPPETYNFKTFNQCASLNEDQRIIMPRHLILKHINSINSFSATTCNICCDNLATVTLKPCEHSGFCEACAYLLELCPLCRTVIVARN